MAAAIEAKEEHLAAHLAPRGASEASLLLGDPGGLETGDLVPALPDAAAAA